MTPDLKQLLAAIPPEPKYPLLAATSEDWEDAYTYTIARLRAQLAVAVAALRESWAGFINLAPEEAGPMRAQMWKHANEMDEVLRALRGGAE